MNKISIHRMFAFALLLILSMPWDAFANGKQNIVIVSSSNSDFQVQTARSIREKLEANGAMAIIIPAGEIVSSEKNVKTLYVAIGENAINSLYEYDSNAFVLRINNRKIPGVRYTSAQSDLITAQSECRHIQLIKALDPDCSTIAMLSSVDSIEIADAFRKCATSQNLELNVYTIKDKNDLLETLETAMEDNEALLAINDPFIYNSNTIKNILLTAYRHRKPVIGYSDNFVQAGAVAAIYTSPESIGNKASKVISGFFDNSWQFNNKVYFTDGFSISTNKQVATSLEISLPSEESIRESIENKP